MKARYGSGLTTVELVVTLFIATAFVLAGYQLYTYVLLRGTQASHQASASRIAYKYLRQYQHDAANTTCSARTPMNNENIPNTNLNQPKMTVTISCPFSSNPQLNSISLITVKLDYQFASKPETVSHASYAK